MEDPETEERVPLCATDDCEAGSASGASDRKSYEDAFAVGQVTIRLPLDFRFLPLMALLISFIPWGIPLLFATDAVITRRFLSEYAIAMMIASSIISEVLLKPILKEPRPSTTAVRDASGKVLPGMPSGHVLMSQSLLTLYTLQAAQDFSQKWVEVLTLCLMMPAMPWARWYNGDHSAKQVNVTFVLATAMGALAFLILVCAIPASWKDSPHHKVLEPHVVPSQSVGFLSPHA
eukprot:TRINITY_DN12819_c0_g1_i2.p1 TRINITY_DN12819_c0_g1~~TRINITY_DN12819_c0_g1_i2.p1  ORF type:complete len:233 (+),score=27.91 TRINITY_DN12819_c0_g1_i2:225-923(+)